jgi:hypothetical protein
MKSRFVFTLISIVAFGAFAQSTPILADFDFSMPGYAILVLPLDGGIGALRDSTADVAYFDQAPQLESMKKGLVGNGKATVYPFSCYDSHAIVVTKGGREQVQWTVSENCHSIETEDESWAFSGYIPLDGYKVATLKTHHFDHLVAARKTLAEFEQDPNLLYIPEPKWRHFDGQFMIMHEHVKVSHDVHRKEIEAFIAKNFPNEMVEIYAWLGSGNSQDGYNFCAEIRCNRTFYEKFRMDGLTYLPFVKPSSFTLESFWKN